MSNLGEIPVLGAPLVPGPNSEGLIIPPEIAAEMEMVTDQELMADLEGILSGPDSEDKAALEEIFRAGEISQSDIHLISRSPGGFGGEGRIPTNPKVPQPYTWKEPQTIDEVNSRIRGLERRIKELQDEKEKIEREIRELRKKGGEERKLQHKEKIQKQVEKWLQDKEKAKTDLEKKLKNWKDGGEDKPITFSPEERRTFVDYFPYTVPTAVIIALLAYLLTRPKLNPARVPRSK